MCMCFYILNLNLKLEWISGGKLMIWQIWLTYWGRVTHICVGQLTIIGSDNGLSPSRRQAIIWTNPGILLIGTVGTNFSEILIEILTFSFKKMRLKMSSAKWRPFCLGLNVVTHRGLNKMVHILQITLNGFSRLEIIYFVPKDSSDKKWSLGWWLGTGTGVKPLPEPMMTKSYDAMQCH